MSPKKNILCCLFYFGLTISSTVIGQQKLASEVSAVLQNDTLYLQNKLVAFTYLWNHGNLILKEAKDNRTLQKLDFTNHKMPDMYLPGEEQESTNATIKITDQRRFPNEHLHKEVAIHFTLGTLEIKHIIKIYPEASALSHTYFCKGKAKNKQWVVDQEAGLGMIEKNEEAEISSSERIAMIPFDGPHWKTNIVSFKEATDYNDNLVFEKEILPYRKKVSMQGNVLMATQQQKDIGFFLIKEAPIDYSQQHYPGYDFQIDQAGITIHGIGISPQDIHEEWVQGYGYAMGLATSDLTALHYAALQYQKQLRKHIPERDGMILSNTWGDRSKDSRMNAAFILKEIEQAAAIGITHVQLDDGWQTGLSRNSASKAGQKWDDWSAADWQPHPERFPEGFKPILAAANKKNVEICLWFNPSKANSYALWERDADILISYYKKYRIKVFKIDGMSFADKQSEINLRKLFTKVMIETQGNVTFNMDVTAGHRVGYHYFNEFGNVFLENRYTDWANYYPHRTLRNLWQLARYVPAERLQIEFLNNTRNPHKYREDDVLAPEKIPLSYTSAITLVAQPLAWMELSNLAKTEELKDQFTRYKKVSEKLHSSVVLPIGQEPSGFSWTGFAACQSHEPTYVLLYREHTQNDSVTLHIPKLKKSAIPNCILGDTISILQDNNDPSRIKINSPKQFSYGLFLME